MILLHYGISLYCIMEHISFCFFFHRQSLTFITETWAQCVITFLSINERSIPKPLHTLLFFFLLSGLSRRGKGGGVVPLSLSPPLLLSHATRKKQRKKNKSKNHKYLEKLYNKQQERYLRFLPGTNLFQEKEKTTELLLGIIGNPGFDFDNLEARAQWSE